MEDSCFEDESNEDQLGIEESCSEIEQTDSETSEDDDEFDLDEVISKVDNTHITQYSSRSGMTWSSIPPLSTRTNLVDNATEKAGPTELTKDVTSIADVFLCFISEKLLHYIKF
ncbi:unnamed protein product [Rotaria sp. Silwood2]|nr:unnamed protein product [Rotaria sp. Silwood2]CAF2516366.1 unnamed protein product [Rotaria sp. Silwood2]CAF2910908.1 unnamed protein product [Rotaria sp. Silwood2]CAF4002298.1 unnamed protein product [Rotaria sp. Silwood2]CAF4065262.1 unnamed protein product [Rotaria sp. Silwood2]